MNQGLKPPCKGCERDQNGFCTGWKRCNVWRLWFRNEWFRIRTMFLGETVKKEDSALDFGEQLRRAIFEQGSL